MFLFKKWFLFLCIINENWRVFRKQKMNFVLEKPHQRFTGSGKNTRSVFCIFLLFCDGKKRNHVNDPSAGSPTETLLRLLLPLNDKV